MAFEERAEIISALEGVDSVIKADDADGTVCETLIKLKPDIFANGGDRKSGNIPEYKLCDELGIEMVFGVGGNDKPQSSSWLVNKVRGEK
jgi:bifunctional ADP-heptose synthase (sugar kinase/adenylyltransferase)